MKLKGIGLNYGTLDENRWISKGCADLAQEMQAAGIPVEVTTFEGSHQGDMRQRIMEEMLPFLSGVLGE
jgi:hypothetical protein